MLETGLSDLLLSPRSPSKVQRETAGAERGGLPTAQSHGSIFKMEAPFPPLTPACFELTELDMGSQTIEAFLVMGSLDTCRSSPGSWGGQT